MPELLQHDLNILDKEEKAVLIGVDEVGRGCLAGPVYAAACLIHSKNLPEGNWLSQINDSKKIAKPKREELAILIKENICYGLGIGSVTEINELGILQATLIAMKRAVIKANGKFQQLRGIDLEPLLLIDGISKIPNLNFQQITLKKGDSKSFAIAAASVLAKVTRDNFMAGMAFDYPHYGWESNVGYGSKKHCKAILTHGVTDMHRRKFLRNLLNEEPQLSLSL
ncbi:MAG TPA: ribonuclease HII [Vampirovibrionales bacterium]